MRRWPPLDLEIQAVQKDAVGKGRQRGIALHIMSHDTAPRYAPKLLHVRPNNRRERLGGTREHVGYTIHDAYLRCGDYLLGKSIVVRVYDKLDQSVSCPHRALPPTHRVAPSSASRLPARC